MIAVMSMTPNISAVLETFFFDAEAGKSAATRARYVRTQAALARYIETVDVADCFGDDVAQLVAAEREFDSSGAFLRIMTAEELVVLLPGFVEDERLPACRADARTQVSMTDRLVAFLIRFRLIDGSRFSRAVLDTQVACATARDRLRRHTEPRLFG